MRRMVLLALAAITVLSLATAGWLYGRYKSASDRVVSTKAAETDAEGRYGDALSAIAEIQDSLGTLGVSGPTRPLLPGSPATERGLSIMRGREALDRIALLKAGIQRTRERLAALEQRVHKDGVRLGGLEHLIANLKQTLSEKEQLAAELTAQVDSLHVQVTGLNTQVAQAQDTIRTQGERIEDQRHELGTVYYLMGTKRALTRTGLVNSRGGVLGLGRTLVPSTPADDHLFTALDTDADRVIHIPAARARVLTAQPASSYALEPNGKELDLRILDPERFCTVRHVVIVLS